MVQAEKFSEINRVADQITQSLERVAQVIGHQSDGTLNLPADHLLELSTNLNQGLFTILMLGRYKNGKSTLLNAIIGDQVVPTDVNPNTAVITFLVYGKNSNQVAVYHRNVAQPEILSHADFFQKYTLTDEDAQLAGGGIGIDRFTDVLYAQIETIHAICQQRVRLVDSPGFGEAESRTQRTLSFLTGAQAVIYVLDATRIFDEDERKMLVRELGDGGSLRNVFFAINRINQVDQSKIDDLKKYVLKLLTPYFSVEGEFDANLYRKRVFYIDALYAIKVRSGNGANGDDTQGNVLALEQAVLEFLASDDRVYATYESAIKLLVNTYNSARRLIRTRKVGLSLTEKEFEQKTTDALQKLDVLAEKQNEIKQEITDAGRRLNGLLRDKLARSITSLSAESASEAIEIGDLELRDFTDAQNNPMVERELRERIRGIVMNYIEPRFKLWLDEERTLLSETIAALEIKTKADLLVTIKDVEAVTEALSGGNVDVEPIDSANTEYLAETIAFDTEQLRTSIQEALSQLSSAATGLSLGWIMQMLGQLLNWITDFLGVKVGLGGQRKEEAREKIRAEILKHLLSVLREDLNSPMLVEGSIKSMHLLAKRLVGESVDPAASFITNALSDATKTTLRSYLDESFEGEAKDRVDVVLALNNLINSQTVLYDKKAFSKVILRDETQVLLKKEVIELQRSAGGVAQLNRWLLCEVLRTELSEKVIDTLYHNVLHPFNQFAERAIAPLAQPIETARATVEDMRAKADTERRNAKSTEEQLDNIERVIHQAVSDAYMAVHGKPFAPELKD